MELLLEGIAQLPLVAVVVYIWWSARQDYNKELGRLRDLIVEKDHQLGEFADAFDKLSLTLELIKDRLR